MADNDVVTRFNASSLSTGSDAFLSNMTGSGTLQIFNANSQPAVGDIVRSTGTGLITCNVNSTDTQKVTFTLLLVPSLGTTQTLCSADVFVPPNEPLGGGNTGNAIVPFWFQFLLTFAQVGGLGALKVQRNGMIVLSGYLIFNSNLMPATYSPGPSLNTQGYDGTQNWNVNLKAVRAQTLNGFRLFFDQCAVEVLRAPTT
jgi:hypothetical protein